MSTKAKTKKQTPVSGGDHIKLDYALLQRAVLTLRAVNHPLRKQILSFIEAEKVTTVTPVYKKLKIEQSVASQHLAVLRKADIVKAERDGKFIYYSVNKKRIADINSVVQQLAQK